MSVHDEVGGAAFFSGLADRFYEGVAGDPVLLPGHVPLYPEQPDLAPARRRLTLFLVQYWGGPGTYSAGRGHPRLRKRHAPFAIGSLQRDRWLVHMFAALEAVGGDIPQAAREHLDHYFTMAADPMRNSPD